MEFGVFASKVVSGNLGDKGEGTALRVRPPSGRESSVPTDQ